ncbi:MAG: Hsp20/alpha crystallin family protein [Candidatus Buchananbacteria bacterium]
MSIIKWTPFVEPFEEMERFVNRSVANGFTPAIDVYETKDEVVVETPLAGIDPKDVEIAVENEVLTIKGEIKKESEVEDKNYYRKEVASGSFFRSVALPSRVLAEKAEASFADGMLKITIPKAEEAKPKMIKVKIKE